MSLVALGAALALSLTLGWAPRRLADAMRPATAVRTLVLAGLAAALTTGFALTDVALTAIAHDGEVAELGHWAPAALPSSGMPWQAGPPVAVAVLALLAAAVVHTLRAGHQLWLADAWCRRLGPDDGRPVVLDDTEPRAFAVAGLRGRVVVTTAMVAALSAAERAALLAHERAHLRHRHHVWIQLAEVSAVANPVLRRVPAVVRLMAERWADEDAALRTGDRLTTAEAIGHAALARTGPRRPTSAALPATGGDVPHRVQALLRAPRHRWSAPAATLVSLLAVAVLVLTGATARSTEQVLEAAQSALAATR